MDENFESRFPILVHFLDSQTVLQPKSSRNSRPFFGFSDCFTTKKWAPDSRPFFGLSDCFTPNWFRFFRWRPRWDLPNCCGPGAVLPRGRDALPKARSFELLCALRALNSPRGFRNGDRSRRPLVTQEGAEARWPKRRFPS